MGQRFSCWGLLWALVYTFERETSEVSCLIFGLQVAVCCRFKSWNALSRPPMCSSVHQQARSVHKPQLPHIFTRRKSSHSVGRCQAAKWRRELHVSASTAVCSERFLPSDYPPWTRLGEGEAGLQASSPEAEVETRGSFAGLSVRLKAGRAPVACPTSTTSWWVTPSFVFGC